MYGITVGCFDNRYILISCALQNAVRIVRALFEIVLRKNNPIMARKFLTMSKMFEHQQWEFESPLRQFRLTPEIIRKIEEKRINIETLRDMDAKEIGKCMND